MNNTTKKNEGVLSVLDAELCVVHETDALPEGILIYPKDEEWNINPKLHDEVLLNMPSDLSLEEKALSIYCKLAKALRYNHRHNLRYMEGFEEKPTLLFNKEYLESLEPNSEIICFDFTRIYCKFISELGSDIKAFIMLEGASHSRTGFHTDNTWAELEATICYNSFNDLYNMKNGIAPQGIYAAPGKEDIIKKALGRVLPLVFERTPTTIAQHMDILKAATRMDTPNDFRETFDGLMKIWQDNHMLGNEVILALTHIAKAKLFGDSIKVCFVGESAKVNGFSTRKTQAIISVVNNGSEMFYAFDPNEMSLKPTKLTSIRGKLQMKDYIPKSGNSNAAIGAMIRETI